MSDEDEITDVEVSDSIGSSNVFELTGEWVTYLASADVPGEVEGVDPSIDDLGGSAQALA
jgi:hypothetical protein